EELFKYSEHNIIGRKINDLVVSEEKINEAKDLSYDAINGEEFYLETVRKSKDGINIDVSISTAPIIINGTQIGFFAIYRDIRKRKIAELEKERKSSLLKALLSNFPDPVYFKNKKREFILANDLAAKDLGLESKKEIIGKKDDDFLSGRVLKETIEEENKVMDDLEPMRKVKKVGDNRWASVTKAPYIDINGKLKGIIGINQDITERKKTELELKKERNRIEYISFHDELTGLYNRRFFEEEMKRFENSRVKPIAIVVADLDNLKVVNDTYGHDKGDEYIINAAKSLKKVTREEDIVARLGGDEFSMILPEVSKKDAESFCERVRKECSKKNVSISLGYAIKKSSDKGLEKTFTKADKKMYEEKRNKRGSRC
ncbi:MAG: sensor domain-containing diguanylate cyclase, partial [Candidatus Woesearchaeota archaeon]